MIDKFLEEVHIRLNSHLNQKKGMPDIDANNSLVVEDISKHERPNEGSTEVEINNKIMVSLVNIEEETSLKNNFPIRREGSVSVQEQSALYLNIYLLIAANFADYFEGAKQLSWIIQYFQFNRSMNYYLDEPREVKFNLHNIGFENLNNLWTVLGGRYLPSVMYKARVLMVQESPPATGSVIVDIDGRL